MDYGHPVNFLKSNTYASKYFTPEESTSFDLLYRYTHDLEQPSRQR